MNATAKPGVWTDSVKNCDLIFDTITGMITFIPQYYDRTFRKHIKDGITIQDVIDAKDYAKKIYT